MAFSEVQSISVCEAGFGGPATGVLGVEPPPTAVEGVNSSLGVGVRVRGCWCKNAGTATGVGVGAAAGDGAAGEGSGCEACEHVRKQCYRELATAAESGWDFSSRWMTRSPAEA